jgi:hypothetical protein
MDQAIPVVDRATVEALVRTAVGNPALRVDSWQTTQLSRQGRRSIFRLAGIGTDGTTAQSWSLILKTIQRPENPAAPDLAVSHWAYWEREYLLYAAGVPQTLAGSLRAPHCFGVAQPTADLRWIWLEDLQDRYGRHWPVERYSLAARQLGRFNGLFLAQKVAPATPYLARDALRWRSQEAVDGFARLADPGLWQHPQLQRAFPRPVIADLRRLLADREWFLAVAAHFPQGFCHLDAWHGNMAALVSDAGDEVTVLFDWALAGYGPPGQEISNLVWSSFLEFKVEIEQAAALEAAVLANYLAGLAEAGWQGDERLVRCAYLISAVLLFGLASEAVDHALNEAERAGLEAYSGWPLERMIDQCAGITYLLLERAGEVRQLVNRLS